MQRVKGIILTAVLGLTVPLKRKPSLRRWEISPTSQAPTARVPRKSISAMGMESSLLTNRRPTIPFSASRLLPTRSEFRRSRVRLSLWPHPFPGVRRRFSSQVLRPIQPLLSWGNRSPSCTRRRGEQHPKYVSHGERGD